MVMPSMLRRFIKENLPADYEDLLPRYAQLDDYDIMTAIKEWQNHPDKVLSILSRKLLERKLLGARVSEETEKDTKVEKMKACATSKYGISKEEARYFVFSETLTNNAYDPSRHRINLLYKDGTLQDIASASDQLNISALTTPVTKNFLFFPKDCRDRR